MGNETKAPQKRSFGDYLKAVGPAIIISAVVVGPGSVTTSSSQGASYGYIGLWLVLFSCIASYFFQESSIRILINKGDTVLTAMNRELHPIVAKIVFVLVYIMTLLAQAGNFLGAGMAMNYFVPGLSVQIWAGILIVLAIVMVFAKKQNILDTFTKVLVFIMCIAFIITAFASHPNAAQVVTEGFSFKVPDHNWMLALALVGTTIVADTPLALSTLNKAKYCLPGGQFYDLEKKDKTKLAKFDLIVSLVVTGIITASIMICSATVLKPQGITISSAADMAIQLTPLLGKFAGIVFSLGLWAAAFSSGAYRIELMPKYYQDAWQLEDGQQEGFKKVVSLCAGLIPLIFVIVWGGNPVQVLIVAQFVVGVLFPIITIVLGILLNKKSYLGEHANKIGQNIAFVIMAAFTLGLAIAKFVQMFS